MIKVAVVEDEDREAAALAECLSRYQQETGESFAITRYKSGVEFLAADKSFDIVFMDIMLPNMSGMEVATQMRKKGSRSILIFVTNLQQFAIKAYEVDALDYILKPISYARVTFKLNKAIAVFNANRHAILNIRSEVGLVIVPSNKIYYIEINEHKLTFVTADGNYSSNGTIKKYEEKLHAYNFARCNACYLVNLQFIAQIKGDNIVMKNGDELKMSRPKIKSFMNVFSNYLGQGRC